MILHLCAAAAGAGEGLEVGDVSCDSCECVIFLSFHIVIVRVELICYAYLLSAAPGG